MNNDRSRAYAALAFICLVWGSSFLAVKIGIDQVGPFRWAFLRQILAVGILLGVHVGQLKFGAAKSQKPWPPRAHVWRQIAIGAVTIGVWNVLVNFAILSIPTSLAALIASLVPAFIAMLSHFWTKTERIQPFQWLGIALGFGGLGLIFGDGWRREMSDDYLQGIFLTLLACVFWAVGTISAKRFSNAEGGGLLLDSAMQLLGAAAIGLLVSLFSDFWEPFHLDLKGRIALFYSVVFGSVLAMIAYLFALKKLPATIASMYTYINPIIALILGILFLNEKMTEHAALGMAITLVGVWLVNRKK